MGSFSFWHLAIVLCIVGTIAFLVIVVLRSGRKAVYAFKPLAGLANWLTGGIALTLLLGAIAWAFYLVEFRLLAALQNEASADLVAAFEKNAERMNSLGLIMIWPVIVTTILGFCWIYRASANLWARKEEDLAFTPGGAIGFYFVPILSLFLPFQAMKEICVRSETGKGTATSISPRLLLLWWLLFIAAWVAKLAKNHFNRNGDTIDGILSANYAAQIELALLFPLSITFLIIVRRVTRLQSAAATHSSSR